ncbi:hypothetical protein ACFYWX_39630 [Streptomyces sp. NPDC002888]|uniref:hypothetical protein n=1 Tax=Streptomyces sp. NPDC002888 TaxID=3364668 RepID=UPI0036B333D4
MKSPYVLALSGVLVLSSAAVSYADSRSATDDAVRASVYSYSPQGTPIEAGYGRVWISREFGSSLEACDIRADGYRVVARVYLQGGGYFRQDAVGEWNCSESPRTLPITSSSSFELRMCLQKGFDGTPLSCRSVRFN